MAIVKEINYKAWYDWVKTRPPEIQELCRKLPPDRLYKMESTGNFVTIESYSESGNVSVGVFKKYNPFIFFDRQVFGVDPDDLHECDLPNIDNSNSLRKLFDVASEEK